MGIFGYGLRAKLVIVHNGLTLGTVRLLTKSSFSKIGMIFQSELIKRSKKPVWFLAAVSGILYFIISPCYFICE
jgi:hypothetical protein